MTFSNVVSQPASRLLSIPAEVRGNILHYALPSNEHVVLDHEYLSWPGYIDPATTCDSEDILSLLCVSKQIYNEALPHLYGNNTISVLEPSLPDSKHLINLSPAALSSITSMEICLGSGLHYLGNYRMIFTDNALPSLRSIKFNFWHSAWWLRTALELAYRSYDVGTFTFKLELFESVFGNQRPRKLDHEIIDDDLDFSSRMARIYPLNIPTNIYTITLSASVAAGDAYEMVTYDIDLDDDPLEDKRGINGWKFKKDYDKVDTPKIKYLVFEGPDAEFMESSK
jgi:hypothetical protein